MQTTPSPCYTADPVEASLRGALQTINAPWVHSFLHPPATSNLDQLHETLLQPFRITADMTIATHPSTAPTLNEHIRFLLLPSFTTGTVTVAYQVTEYVTTALTPCKEPYIARCVRDDQHGLLVTFAEHDNGTTEITVCTLLGPGVRDHVFMVVLTAPFRAVMDEIINTGTFHEGSLTGALVYSFQSCEIRECPKCKIVGACACPLELVRKTHPMDFNADIVNLRNYLGSYEGVSYQAIYESGVNLYNGVCSTSTSVEFSYDNEGRRRLESWALWDTLMGKVNLYKLVMPDDVVDVDPAVVEHLSEDVDPALGLEHVGANAEGKELAWSPFSIDEDAPLDMEIEQFIGENVPTDLLPDLGTIDGTVAQDSSVRSHTEGTDVFHETCEQHQAAMFSHVSAASEVDEGGQPIHGDDQQVPQPQHVSTASATRPTPEPLTPNVQALLLLNGDADSRPRRVGRPPGSKERGVTRVLPIVPATKATAEAGVQKAMNNISAETRGRMELRKARNRASAMRSNEKKKKQLQDLKDSLEDAKKTEAALRQEERELRETNLALRAKLAD